MALAYETVYGTPPVSGFKLMPFARATLGAEQPLLESELLGYGRDPLAPIKDAVISFTRAQETELPRALKWRLLMPDEDYGALSVEARRITVDTARVRTEQFPIVYPAALADRAARRALYEEWVGREDAAFALPPSRLALDPTDVIRLEHDGRTPDYVLARITDGGARRIEAKRTDQTLYDLPPGPERTPAYVTPTVYGPPAGVASPGRRGPGASGNRRGPRPPTGRWRAG